MKSGTNKYTKEVEDTLNRLSLKKDKEKAAKLKKYIGTAHEVIGLVTNVQVATYKKGFSFYSENKETVFFHFDTIYKESNVFEAKNLAFIFLDKHHKHISLKTQLQTLPHWVSHVDNWAHSDSLSKYLTRLIEDKSTQAKMLAIIKKWNASKNLWERRQSLIALYYYARTKKEHISFELTQTLVLPLLRDKEYYVQKAVGWTLRESYNVYPKQTYAFIDEHVKQISPVAFTTCIEKMTEKEKITLKLKRKNR
ncbi:MAG: DNA alkylation repair protein [Bacteroidetes bacterium]|nr:DNA alkylation repair protein [Bacteroidota bacterium]